MLFLITNLLRYDRQQYKTKRADALHGKQEKKNYIIENIIFIFIIKTS